MKSERPCAGRSDGVPDDQARAFTWAVLEHRRSYAEIEEHTGWSRSKIKISVFRARKRVMQELEALGLAPEGDGKEERR